MRHIKFFMGAQIGGSRAGGKKFMLKHFMCFVLSPLGVHPKETEGRGFSRQQDTFNRDKGQKCAISGRSLHCQKAADVWKKDVWDFQAFSQTFFELRFSLGNEGKDGKNLNSQTWLGTPRRPSPRHPRPPYTGFF